MWILREFGSRASKNMKNVFFKRTSDKAQDPPGKGPIASRFPKLHPKYILEIQKNKLKHKI